MRMILVAVYGHYYKWNANGIETRNSTNHVYALALTPGFKTEWIDIFIHIPDGRCNGEKDTVNSGDLE